jgi:Domain of unknown function (DUF4279)
MRSARKIHVFAMKNACRAAVRRKQFDHDYSSCSRTYATFCIYHDRLESEQITALLRLKPDRIVRKGNPAIKGTTPRNGWFLTTQGRTDSKDIRSHIALLIQKLSPRKKNLNSLKKRGCEFKIMCLWESASGNGGPYLNHAFLKELSVLPIDLDFDIWFPYNNEPKAR